MRDGWQTCAILRFVFSSLILLFLLVPVEASVPSQFNVVVQCSFNLPYTPVFLVSYFQRFVASWQMAVDEINNSSTLLPGRTLNLHTFENQGSEILTISDVVSYRSDSSPLNGTILAIDSGVKYSTISASCKTSAAMDFVSVTSAMAHSDFGDISEFPTTFRIRPSHNRIGEAYTDWFDANGWERVAVLFQRSDVFIADLETSNFFSRDVTMITLPSSPAPMSDISKAANAIITGQHRIVLIAADGSVSLALVAVLEAMGVLDNIQVVLGPGLLGPGLMSILTPFGLTTDTVRGLVSLNDFGNIYIPSMLSFTSRLKTYLNETGRADLLASTSAIPVSFYEAYGYDSAYVLAYVTLRKT